MPEPVVNASPLIFLSKGDVLDLLRLEGQRVRVPHPVAEEILQRGADDVTARALDTTPWLDVVEAPIPLSAIQAWGLGAGESAVLTLAAASPGSRAILDDAAGRRCAASLGVPVIGTLGLVLKAKTSGEIRAARPVVERLLATGMYLSRPVVDSALALVGE